MLEHSNSHNVASSTVPAEKDYFQTPFVPVIPFIGMAIDWYTIAQLEVVGLLLLGLYLGTAVALYLMCLVARASTGAKSLPRNKRSIMTWSTASERFMVGVGEAIVWMREKENSSRTECNMCVFQSVWKRLWLAVQ